MQCCRPCRGFEPSDDIRVASIDATASLTNAGFQALLLINGGALVALLTLVGAIWDDCPARADWLLRALAQVSVGGFVGGLAFAILGIGLAFRAQVAIGERRRGRAVSMRMFA
jgi:hypothetical protein